MVGHYRFGIHKSELDNSDSCMSLFGSKWKSEDKITPHVATLEKKQKLDGVLDNLSMDTMGSVMAASW